MGEEDPFAVFKNSSPLHAAIIAPGGELIIAVPISGDEEAFDGVPAGRSKNSGGCSQTQSPYHGTPRSGATGWKALRQDNHSSLIRLSSLRFTMSNNARACIFFSRWMAWATETCSSSLIAFSSPPQTRLRVLDTGRQHRLQAYHHRRRDSDSRRRAIPKAEGAVHQRARCCFATTGHRPHSTRARNTFHRRRVGRCSSLPAPASGGRLQWLPT